MKRFFLTLCAVCATTLAWAATEVVNGITWEYTVSYGEVMIGLGEDFKPSIPKTTSGSVTIPSTLGGYPVTSIGRYAFYNCTGLTSVTIPEGLTSIGGWAFAYCPSLVSIKIPESVVNIGDGTFCYCSSLTSITIPKNVTSLSSWTFYNCTALASVEILSTEINVYSAFLNTAPTTLTAPFVPSGMSKENLTSVTILDGITSIQGYAFSNCSGLTSITIPDSVTSIGEQAFEGCSGLTSITIPEGVTSIGERAFYYCESLRSILFEGEPIESVGSNAFPYNVKGYYYACYEDAWSSYWGSWNNLTMEEFVDSNAALFSYSVANNEATITGLRGECPEELVIPAKIDGWPVTTIGLDAFYNCTNLTSVVISEGVTVVGAYAFSGCSALTSITLPDSLTEIGWWAFNFCGELSSVTLPEGLKTIGAYAFRCTNLTFVTIPSSVTEIGDGAFDAASLKGVTFKGVPPEIGDGVFDCSLGYYFRETAASWEAACTNGMWNNLTMYEITDGDEATADIFFTYTVTDGKATITGLQNYYYEKIVIPAEIAGVPVVAIGSEAFSGCSWLTAITIPSGITEIDDTAFSGVAPTTLTATWVPGGMSKDKLVTVIIPEGTTSIPDYAFSGCSGLTSVTIPDSVTSIGEWVFDNCPNLYKDANGVQYESEAKVVLIKAPSVVSGEFIMPSSVRFVQKFPFFDSDCTELTLIEIPASTSLNYQALAFYFAPKLKIVVDDQNPFYVSQDGALFTKDMKTIIRGPGGTETYAIPDSVTELAKYSFSGCSQLTTVTIPDSVVEGGYCVFSFCSSLVSVKIPEGITRIGAAMFRGCSSLVSVNLPSTLTYIGLNAFDECTSLTSIVFPESLESIEVGAFYNCPALTSVTIPANVYWIGADSFRYDSSYEGTNLTSVNFLGLPPSDLSSGAFPEIVATFPVEYIAEWAAKVDADGKWRGLDFSASLEFDIAFDLNGIEGGYSETLRYGSLLTSPATEREGYTFLGWSPELPETVPAVDTTYIAQWQINQYTHIFDANDGEGGTSLTLDYGSALTAPAVSREGYAFMGWSPAVPSAVPAANATYTAQWQINQYTHTFDANGGEGGMTVTQDYGSALAAPMVSRFGYTFLGWLPDVPSTVPAENVTYVAQWKANQYTFVFNANGGEGGKTVTLDYGSPLVAPTVSRIGYTLVGWSPALPAIVPAGNVVYTAQWQVNHYTHTFDANGGEGGAAITLEYGAVLTPPTVSREGYTFLGWSQDVPQTMPAGDMTYTARWQINQYTVIFDANGGEGGSSVTQDYGSAITVPEVSREGHIFLGWSPEVPATVPAADVTYTAQWQDVSFLTYTIEGGVATITGLQAVYPATLEIPATIGEIPVVAIAERAFAGCTALTSVSIPATVTTIGTGAFTACGSPVITVAEENSAYASADGVLFNKEMTTLISAPCVTDSYTLPETVSAIGPSAFENCAGTLAFPGAPFETVGEGAFPAVQGSYRYEYVTTWKAVIADGKWHNLTMSCANPPSFDVTLTAVGGGSVSGGGVYTWGETVTVTATADADWVFCGWSSTPTALTVDYTFEMPEHAVALTAYFAPKQAVDLTIDRYLAENELISKDEIKEMAFETPIVEVGADEIEISISLQTAESLNAWNPMILQGATLEIDEANGMVRVRVPKGDKKAAFYKFVVPTEQSK